MKLLTFALVATLACLIPFGADAAGALPIRPALLVYPGTVHAGDWVYLSGGHFPRGGPAQVAMTCSGSASIAHRLPSIRLDREHTFIAHRVRIPRGLGQAQCRFQAQRRSGAHASWGLPAFVRVVPVRAPLPRCARHICLRSVAFLLQGTKGAVTDIEMQGWPGATVALSIVRAGVPTIHRHFRLLWQGTRSIRLTIAPSLKQARKAHVHLSARFGRISGQANPALHVLPPGPPAPPPAPR